MKGYTASTASAEQLRMMAMSVVNTSVFIRLPFITIPLTPRASFGTSRMWCLSLLLMWGMAFFCSKSSPPRVFVVFVEYYNSILLRNLVRKIKI